VTLTSLDTNILVYAFQAGPSRERALAVLAECAVGSVQLLNEYAQVSRRKFKRSWAEIEIDLETVRRALGRVDPITDKANRGALRLAQRYRLSIYDSVLIAVALEGGVRTLYSEDMHDGLLVDEALRIVNPFR